MKKITLVLLMISAFAFQGKAQKVTNVKSSQQDEKIIVSFKTEGGRTNNVYIPTLYYSIDGGNNFNKCNSINAQYAIPNKTGEIIWNVTSDLDYFGGDEIIFEVKLLKNNWKFKTTDRYFRGPVSSSSMVFIRGDNSLYGINLFTGKQQWRFKVKRDLYTPFISGKYIFIGSKDKYLYALNQLTGKEIWKSKIDKGIAGHQSIVVANNIVFFISEGDKYLIALDINTGKEKWIIEPKHYVFDGLSAINNYLILSDGSDVICIDPKTSKEKWKITNHKNGEDISIIANGVVVVGTGTFGLNKHICAYDLQTGRKKWEFKATNSSKCTEINPTIADGVVYVGTNNFSEINHVYALDLNTGKQKWKVKTGYDPYAKPAVASNLIIFDGSYESYGYLIAVNRKTGKQQWKIKKSLDASPVVSNGFILIKIDKEFHAIDFLSNPVAGKSSMQNYQIYSKRGADFKNAVELNTIDAYELFLAKNFKNKKLNNQAIASIYKLTAQMDAVEGYRSFLQKYPKAADAVKATKRLYEIMYAIAEEENDIASYYGFLVQFPKSQVVLRDKAYINMQMLEVEKATNKYNESKEDDNDHELKERIARQLYVEAIRAKEGGDNYTFMRKYNTVLYSDLFKDTQAAFDLFRDKELAKLIRELRDEIRQNTYAINRMTSAITNKLNDIQSNISNLQSTVASSQNDYSSYLEDMVSIQRNQANDWAEWATNGTKPSGWFGSPNSY